MKLNNNRCTFGLVIILCLVLALYCIACPSKNNQGQVSGRNVHGHLSGSAGGAGPAMLKSGGFGGICSITAVNEDGDVVRGVVEDDGDFSINVIPGSWLFGFFGL